MVVYRVGMKLGVRDGGIAFDGEMLTILVALHHPTKQEMAEFKKDFEIGLWYYRNILVFPYKFGELSGDYCYNPHMSEKIEVGYSNIKILAMMLDSRNGEIKAIRLSELPTDFSNVLNNVVREEQNKLFNKVEYYMNVRQMWENMQTKDIFELSSHCCKIDKWVDTESIIGYT